MNDEVKVTGSWLMDTISGMVDDVAAVRVESRKTSHGTLFWVKVANEDIGKVIGKRGHHARSIRSILGAMGAKHGQRFDLDLEEAL